VAVARNFDPQSAKLAFEHLLALAITGVASRVGNRLVASAISATETDAGCRRWERDAEYTLCGNIRVDDAYLDGELAGARQAGTLKARCLLYRPFLSVRRPSPV